MSKKKITFDIDENVYLEIKDFCSQRNMKLSDYWRDSASEKLDRDKGTMTILAGKRGMEEFVIQRNKYNIKLFDAEPKIHKLTGAVHEGELLPRKSGIPIEDVIGSQGSSLNELLENLPEGKEILFLTLKKYDDSSPQDWGDGKKN